MKSNVESGQVDWGDGLVSFLGAKDPTEGAEGLRTTRIKPARSQNKFINTSWELAFRNYAKKSPYLTPSPLFTIDKKPTK